MLCNNLPVLITQEDFDCIGQVAMHCDNTKLCIGINEAINFDLSELFCGFWEDIVVYWQQVEDYDTAYAEYLIELAECEADPECTTPPVAPVQPEKYTLKKQLMCGGYYTGCNDKQKNHFGIKHILVYYAYARYVMINSYTDTASGMKIKTNEFSMPTPLKEVEMISDRYRTMGYESFKKTRSFLCTNKDIFTGFDSNDCGTCGCGCDSCKGTTKARGYGFNSSIIRKRL